jgi:hypothetical protein
MSQPFLSPEPPPDDLDRLFTRLDTSPPPVDFTACVLSQTVHMPQRQAARRGARFWGAVALVSLLALGASGYFVGTQLATSDGLLLIRALSDDFSLLVSAPGDVVAVLGESIPWALVVLATFCAGVLTWAAGQVAAALTHAPSPASRASG